ncbi:MAG: TonB-dependent receptor, partial [Desulfurobacteriaceae bacterium]
MVKFFFIFLALFVAIPSFALSPPQSYFWVENELKIISATKELTSYTSTPRFVKVITREEIERLGAKNLFELLEHLPEFYVYKSQLYLWAVGLFGLKQSYFSEKIQVFIDGFPIADPTNGSSFSSNNNISLDNVKRVEIVYGPMTSLYGVNSCLAIINLITYNSEDVKNAKVGMAISTSGSNDSFLMKSFERNDFNGIISLIYREDKGPDKSYTDWLGRSGNFDSYLRHFTYYVKLNKGNFYAKLYGVSKYNENPINIVGLTLNNENPSANRFAVLNTLGYKKEEKEGSFDFHIHINWFYLKKNFIIYPQTFYLSEERYTKNLGLGSYLTHIFPYGKFGIGLEISYVKLYDYKLSANFHPSEVDLSNIWNTQIIPYQELPPSEHLMEKASRTTFSPYFQYQLIRDKTSTLLNLRLDSLSDVGTAATFSFSHLYKLSQKLSLKLNLGRAVRAPSFEEMYLKNNTVLLGNKNLKFEKMDSIMPSLEFRDREKRGRVLLYLYRIKDLIYRKTIKSIVLEQWENADKNIYIKGLLLDIKKKVKNFEFYGGLNK